MENDRVIGQIYPDSSGSDLKGISKSQSIENTQSLEDEHKLRKLNQPSIIQFSNQVDITTMEQTERGPACSDGREMAFDSDRMTAFNESSAAHFMKNDPTQKISLHSENSYTLLHKEESEKIKMIVTETHQHKSSIVNIPHEFDDSEVYNSQTHMEILNGRKEANQHYSVMGSDQVEKQYKSAFPFNSTEIEEEKNG